MKVLLTIICCGIFTSAYCQQVIRFNDTTALSVSVYWKTSENLYFKTTSRDHPYKIPLAQLISIPSTTAQLKSDNPDWYIMQFRRKQLTGIWLTILGAGITTAGVLLTEDKTSPLVYGGLGITLIGFGFHVGSYYNLEKYYVLKSAEPYKH